MLFLSTYILFQFFALHVSFGASQEHLYICPWQPRCGCYSCFKRLCRTLEGCSCNFWSHTLFINIKNILLAFESWSVSIRSSLSRIFPSDVKSIFKIFSSIAFSWFLSVLILTMSLIRCPSNSGFSSRTTSLETEFEWLYYSFVSALKVHVYNYPAENYCY